jgi:hypothetical protein
MRILPRKNFPVENSPAGFSGEKPNGAGTSQGYANDCGVCATLRDALYTEVEKSMEKYGNV